MRRMRNTNRARVAVPRGVKIKVDGKNKQIRKGGKSAISTDGEFNMYLSQDLCLRYIAHYKCLSAALKTSAGLTL